MHIWLVFKNCWIFNLKVTMRGNFKFTNLRKCILIFTDFQPYSSFINDCNLKNKVDF